MDPLRLFLTVFLRFFFLLTPFAVVSAFLTLTRDQDHDERRRTAVRSTVAVIVICLALSLIGKHLFVLFGITLDSFRVGAGTLLFLSGVRMVMGQKRDDLASSDEQDVAVVPLAMPIVVGPGTTGALLVMGAELTDMGQRLIGAGALLAAILVVGAAFLLADPIERVLGPRGLAILTKLAGLFLTSLAAEIIFTGVVNLLMPALRTG